MVKLYHPDLPEGQNETEVTERAAEVLKKNGWQKTPPKKTSAKKEEKSK